MNEMANAHALVVGIAQYVEVRGLPPSVTADAVAVRDVLVDPALCGYPPDHVRLLLDAEATRDALLGALADLAARADPTSSVLVYVSSHGGRLPEGPHAGEYLMTHDTRMSSQDDFVRSAISGEELTEALRAIEARKVLVVFDCCHSGGIGRPKDVTAPEVEAGLPDDYYARLAQGRGRAILSSSRDTESSFVMPNAANSLFTEHLLAGLRGGVPSEDGVVRVFDLFEYVQPRVTHDHAGQHPVFKAELEENFPVALYAGGATGVVPKDAQGFRYDAYVSYADTGSDSEWVWSELLPRLKEAGLTAAVSGTSGDPGVPVVVNAERGIEQAKRTVLVLSDAYLDDQVAAFENVLAQTMDVMEGTYRVIPVRLSPIAAERLPKRLAMLTSLDLTRPLRREAELARLTEALRGPVPGRATVGGGA